MEEQELIRRLLSGPDAEAARCLVGMYLRRVYGVARAIVWDDHAAEDVTQVVFARAFRALSQYRLGESFWRWLCAITRNAAYDALRKSKREPLVFGSGEKDGPAGADYSDCAPTPEELAMAAELKDRIAACTAKLPAELRAVLGLRTEGFTHTEVCDILKIASGTAASRYRRAKEVLAECLGRSLVS